MSNLSLFFRNLIILDVYFMEIHDPTILTELWVRVSWRKVLSSMIWLTLSEIRLEPHITEVILSKNTKAIPTIYLTVEKMRKCQLGLK